MTTSEGRPKAQEVALTGADQAERMIEMVVDSVSSPSTKRNYARGVRDFLSWYRETGQTVLSKATVQRYVARLREDGKSPANVNQRLAAIRKLASEAMDNGLMPLVLGLGVQHVKGIRQEGHRTGNWLSKRQAETLLNAPDRHTLKGKRDRAMLAILIGCGLRRQELATLTFGHIQQRDARWVIVDLVGKRNKVRSVPMPSWAKARVDVWAASAGIRQGRVFRPVNKGGRQDGASMTAQALYMTVQGYADALGVDGLACHDLRRTYAKLAHKGGSAIEQIQLSLGHASLKTTQVYLGIEQSMTNAPCDYLGLEVAV